MAVNGNFFKLCNMMGNYRHFLSSRIILPIHRPVATSNRTPEKNELPSKPKKPKSAYLQFTQQIRPTIAQKYPDMKAVELTKILAQEWHKADTALKTKLEEEYKVNLQEYLKSKEIFEQSMTDEQKEQLKMAKIEAKNAKEKKLHRKAIKELGKPKRPASAFNLWVTSLGGKRGEMKLSEWQKSMQPKWEVLPEDEREVFEVKAANAMNKYKHDLKEWEEKMITVGNHDLIRYGVHINAKTKEKKKSPE